MRFYPRCSILRLLWLKLVQILHSCGVLVLKNYKTNDEVALSRPSERSWYCVRQRSTADAIFGLCDRHCLVWVCMRMFSVQAQFGRVTICQCNSQLRPHDSPKCLW